MHEFVELKHAMQTYINICGHSAELSVYLTKSVDFVDDILGSRDPRPEMVQLAYIIVLGIADNIVMLYETPDFVGMPELMPARNKLVGDIALARAAVDKAKAKRDLLIAVSTALKIMGDTRGIQYPAITDASGVLL